MNEVMELEGERKKRKIAYHEKEEEEEDDEEVKMEKFFALIRNVKDIRDQLSDRRNWMQTENQRPPPASRAAAAAATTTIAPATRAIAKRVQDESKGETAVWQPCFKPKDVAGNSQVSKTDPNLITKQVATVNSFRRSEEEKHKADHINNNNNNNNSSSNLNNKKSNIQAGRRSGIGFDLNHFPVSVTDLDSTDFSK